MKDGPHLDCESTIYITSDNQAIFRDELAPVHASLRPRSPRKSIRPRSPVKSARPSSPVRLHSYLPASLQAAHHCRQPTRLPGEAPTQESKISTPLPEVDCRLTLKRHSGDDAEVDSLGSTRGSGLSSRSSSRGHEQGFDDLSADLIRDEHVAIQDFANPADRSYAADLDKHENDSVLLSTEASYDSVEVETVETANVTANLSRRVAQHGVGRRLTVSGPAVHKEQNGAVGSFLPRRGCSLDLVVSDTVHRLPHARPASTIVRRPSEDSEVESMVINSHRLEAAVSKSLQEARSECRRQLKRPTSPLRKTQAPPEVARVYTARVSETPQTPVASFRMRASRRSQTMQMSDVPPMVPLSVFGPKVGRLCSDPAPSTIPSSSNERLDLLISFGDVLTVRDTGRMAAIGTTGGFYGHAMLVIAMPRGYRRFTPDAEPFEPWPDYDSSYIWEVRTLECTRSERGLHESRLLMYVQATTGRILLMGEVNKDNEVVEFERREGESPEVVEVWQCPLELRVSPRMELMEMVIMEMKQHEANWSWSTAVRAFLLTAGVQKVQNSADRIALFEQIQKCWIAEPICTSVVITFWQRYICKMVQAGVFSASAIDLILRWMPLKADRVLPGELCETLRSCHWTHIRRVPLRRLEEGLYRESSV